MIQLYTYVYMYFIYTHTHILFQIIFHYRLLHVLSFYAHLDFYLLIPRVAGFNNGNSFFFSERQQG